MDKSFGRGYQRQTGFGAAQTRKRILVDVHPARPVAPRHFRGLPNETLPGPMIIKLGPRLIDLDELYFYSIAVQSWQKAGK
ncbi:MAG: hypothetical protein ACK4Z4_02290 [Ferrovibrio sp.]